MIKKIAFHELTNLLFTRGFGTFWFASLLANIGTWAQQLAQPWLMFSLGASSFLIGLDAFVLGAPIWLLTFAGAVAACGRPLSSHWAAQNSVVACRQEVHLPA